MMPHMLPSTLLLGYGIKLKRHFSSWHHRSYGAELFIVNSNSNPFSEMKNFNAKQFFRHISEQQRQKTRKIDAFMSNVAFIRRGIRNLGLTLTLNQRKKRINLLCLIIIVSYSNPNINHQSVNLNCCQLLVFLVF